MPLLLLDLDNTLLDRAGPFRAVGERFLDEIGAPHDDIDWLLSVDADGLTDRWDVADAIRDRYGLRIPSIDLVEELHDGRGGADPARPAGRLRAADRRRRRLGAGGGHQRRVRASRTPRSAGPGWTGTSPTG